MSTSMKVTSEREYRQFINKISDDMSIDEILDQLDEISYCTEFSGRLDRLYDVVEEFEQFEDHFTKEYLYDGFKTSVANLVNTVESLDSREIFIKWDIVIDRFEDEDDLIILVDI